MFFVGRYYQKAFIVVVKETLPRMCCTTTYTYMPLSHRNGVRGPKVQQPIAITLSCSYVYLDRGGSHVMVAPSPVVSLGGYPSILTTKVTFSRVKTKLGIRSPQVFGKLEVV